MTTDIHGKLATLAKAVDTLEKLVEKYSDKLDKINDDIVAGKALLRAFKWSVPITVGIIVAIVNALLLILFHFWK